MPRPQQRRRPQARSRPRGGHIRPKGQPIADEVPRIYEGKTAVLMATGPSLSHEDIEYLRPLHERGEIVVFGLNDCYKWCDYLDIFYFCDPRWLDSNQDAMEYISLERR